MNKKIIIGISLIVFTILVIIFSVSSVKVKTPYIALNMLLQTPLKVNNRNLEYLEFLENSFGIDREQIEQVYNFLSTQTNGNDVKFEVRQEISKSLEEYKNIHRKKIEFFIVNILAPYLTLTANMFYVMDNDKQEIHRIFNEIFDNNNSQRDVLYELEQGTLDFHSGGYFNLDYTLNMNYLLRTKGYYLDYDVNGQYSNIFRISEVADIKWKNNQKIYIFLLKRIYPNALQSRMGSSGVFADNVIVIEDFYPLLAKEYYKKAKKRNVDLDSKDFIKSNLKQIEKDLIIQTAIHEAKHKVDELEKPNQRLSVDNEISAHLTAAIFSSCPFNGLNSAIGRMEGFQRNVNSWALNDIVRKLKKLESKTLNQNYKPEQLKADLQEIYENYRTIRENESLIDLNDFKNYVIPEIYKTFK